MQLTILMFIAIIAMMFFMQRSQKKQQAQRQELLNSVKPGNEVVTIGGLHGVISEIDDTKKTVTIDCEGIFLEFDRASIRTVKPTTVETTVAKEEPAEKKEDTTDTQDSEDETDEKE